MKKENNSIDLTLDQKLGEKSQIYIHNINWLEIIFVIFNIIFIIWSFGFNSFLFTIEITLPMGIFVLFPCLIISFIFFIHIFESSNKISILIDRKQKEKIILRISKLKTKEYSFALNDLEKIELSKKKLDAGSGLFIIFHIFFGLGFLFYAYELIDVGAIYQSILFLFYGIFAIISILIWMFIYPNNLKINFSNYRNNLIPLSPLINKIKLENRLKDIFSFNSEDKFIKSIYKENKIKGEKNKFSLNRIDFYCIFIVFLCSYFTNIYNFQLIDTVSAILLLLYVNRGLAIKYKKYEFHYIKKDSFTLNSSHKIKINQEKNSNFISKTISNLSLSFEQYNIPWEEFLLWLYLLNEIGWKFWYNLTLIIIDPNLFTLNFLIAVILYMIILIAFCIVMIKHRKDNQKGNIEELNTIPEIIERNYSKFDRNLLIIIIIIILLPISGILTALRIIPFATTIFGMKPPV